MVLSTGFSAGSTRRGEVGTVVEDRGGINRLMAEVFEASFERRGVTVPENVPFALTKESLSDS